MKIFWISFVVAVSVSCGTKSPEVALNPISADTAGATEIDTALVESEIPTSREKFNATETVLTDLIHTKLEVKFDWQKQYMYGIETLTAKPHFYSTDSLILKAKGMQINSIKLDGNTLNYQYVGDLLRINLGKTFTRKDSYTIVIDYIAKPEERQASSGTAITSDKGLYFINPLGEDKGIMPQIWTQGETESSSVWFPTIDAPNSKTSQEIFMTVDDKYATLSNGKLMASKKNADGTRTDHWKQELKHAPYLFMMGVGEFKIVKDSYVKKDGSKMDVNYYVEPEWEKYAKNIFGETPEMIRYFSKILGVEYPWDKYHQIVVRDYVSGAMENTGAVIFGDYVYKTNRELLDENDQSTIAHELFHHWFGDYVTCESWSNLPLNESFANYSQYLWDEHRYGKDQADYYAIDEAEGYFQSAQMQGYHDLIWYTYDEKDQMFDGHSYNKGGRILHMLRNHIGDEAFFASLNLYLEQNKFKAAEFHNLRLAFEEITGQDLNWFFDQWFLGSGHPILDISQTIDGQNITLSMKQSQNLEEFPIFRLPMEVALFDDAGKHIYPIVLDQVEQTFTFPISGKLKTIVPDYQQMLLAKVREVKPQEQYIEQYYVGEKYKAREEAIRFGTKKIDSLSQKLILDGLADPFWGIRVLAIEKAGKLKDENKTLATDLIFKLAQSDVNSNVRTTALKYIDNLTDDRKLTLYSSLIDSDSSYNVVSAALRNLGKTNPDLALQKAKTLETAASSKMLVGVANLYSTHGDDSKIAFFEKILTGKSLGGFDQVGAMNTFSMFISKRDVTYWEQALPTYQLLEKNGNYYTKMFLPQNVEFLMKGISENQYRLNAIIESNTSSENQMIVTDAKSELIKWDLLQVKYGKLIPEND